MAFLLLLRLAVQHNSMLMNDPQLLPFAVPRVTNGHFSTQQDIADPTTAY